jgi:formylglycine-generating enzyme required for sulfatase activity
MTRHLFLGLAVLLASNLSASAQPKDPPKKFTNSLGMEFAPVPKGKSWLGGGLGKEGTNEVNFAQDFYLGVYAVTQDEWQKIMGKNPSHFSRGGKGADAVKDIADADLKRFPVESVSWDEAKEFVKLLNEKVKNDAREAGWEYRLPTQQQWEYACRGGPMTDRADSAFDYYFEKPSKTLSREQANFGAILKRTCKVGSYPPNRLGLHDMHGNVMQWCEDLYWSEEVGLPARVGRGGGWFDGAAGCRAWTRYGCTPSFRASLLGFRLARIPSTGK